MNAVVTLRVKIKNLSEEGLLVLKSMVQEDEEHNNEVTDREAIVFAAIEWLTDGHSVGGETYEEQYNEHGVHIYNRTEGDVEHVTPRSPRRGQAI